MITHKMTDEDKLRVLKWFRLKSLLEATKDNWPWWVKQQHPQVDPADYVDLTLPPYMPDFPNDDKASVELVQNISGPLLQLQLTPYSWGWRCTIVTEPMRDGVYKRNSIADCSSLGETALKALEALS